MTYDQIHEKKDFVIFDSKRYGHPVLVPKTQIDWSSIPGEVPGTAGHWCGRPRNGNASWPVTDTDPDPAFHTFCAFMNPGGV